MISIKIAQDRYYPKSFIFSGGEVQISLPDHMPSEVQDYMVTAIIKSSDDITKSYLSVLMSLK